MSFSKLGRDTRGDYRERRISSAKATTLKSLIAMVMPLISELAFNLFKRGSRDITKIRGDSGHPCCVPLLMVKAFGR